jgi:Rps23 Pro-64 3,4-dihydroxylase Tpa1-like proline 4-hydroxylase
MQLGVRTQFLPLGKMQEVAAAARAQYASAEPFPHLVLDNLFDPEILRAIIEEFPKPSDIEWTSYKNVHEVKLESNLDEHFGPVTRIMLYHMNSAPFLMFLSKITGIPGLIADSYFDGGGMHQIERGGKLAIHADFNHHPATQLDRRLNALLYLNEKWHDDYGGHLELWDRTMTSCVKKIAPVFNRMVVFDTTDYTYHGHPDALTCPPSTTRKSLALYYFTNGRPDEEVSGTHSTLFRTRPGENLEDRYGVKIKRLAKDILPPVLTRFVSRRIRSR